MTTMRALRGADRMAFDRGSVRTFDRDGRLHVAVSNISKATVNDYKGSEIPGAEELGLDPDRVYRVLRPAEELARAARTFNSLPILSRHVPVTAERPRQDLIVGATGTDAEFAAPYLRNSLVFWAASAIDDIVSGAAKELSCAYHYRAIPERGMFQGQPYDIRMADIVGNHVAICEIGRAGSDVVVGDSAPKLDDDIFQLRKKPMAEHNPLQKLADAFNRGDGKGLAHEYGGTGADEDPEADLVALLRSLGLRSEDESKIMAAIERVFTNGGSAADDPPDFSGGQRKGGAMDAVREMQAIRSAEADVAPFVGAVLGQDSAAAVYGEAIRRLGGKTFGAPPSAYRAIFDRMRGRRSESQLAQDAAQRKSFEERWPGAARIRVLG